MKQTIKLSIIYFKEQILNAFNGFNKKAQAKTIPIIILLILLLASAIGYSLYNIAEVLNMVGGAQNVLIIGSFMGLFMSLMLTLSDTQGVMYKTKDYPLLASLPLKNYVIVSAKFIGSYLTILSFYALVSIPTFIIYFVFCGVNAFNLILGLLSILFMPAFAQFINSILGFVVNLIASKLKNKNIFRAVISLIFAIGLALFISFSSSNVFEGLFAGGLPTWFKVIFSSIYFLFVSITTNNLLYYLYAILVSLAFICLAVMVLLLCYKKINSSLMVSKSKGKPAPIIYKQKTVFARLLKKEYATLFNCPVYCVNCLIGLIMGVVAIIISITSFSQYMSIPMLQDISLCVAMCCMAMCLGVAPTTSVSISIEGSKFQNIKALPVSFRDVALSKCFINLSLSIPVIIVSIIVTGIISKTTALLVFLVLLYLLFVTISQTVLGLLLNLKFPRLKWSSETQAVKNGASMITTMVIDMVVSFLPMIVFMIITTHTYFSLTTFMAILIPVQFVYSLILNLILLKKGKSLFNKIQV